MRKGSGQLTSAIYPQSYPHASIVTLGFLVLLSLATLGLRQPFQLIGHASQHFGRIRAVNH